MTNLVPDGKYTIVYPNNEYRTVQVKTPKQGALAGKQIFSLPAGEGKFNGVAFVTPAGLAFWKKYTASTPEVTLQRVRKAWNVISANPEAAGKAYGVMSHRCYRCGRELTTPASLAAGIGPECAGKGNWKRIDQIAAAIAMRPVKNPLDCVHGKALDETCPQCAEVGVA